MNGGEARERALVDRMLAEAERAERYVRRGREAFFDPNDQETRDLAQFYIGHFLETAAKVGQSFREANPLIPWRRLNELRQAVIHEYADAALPKVLWKFIGEELPGVSKKLRRARFP
ncbi:MAG: HepT-like ribonuclease domain-containing protein [Thermoplasmata archaeon]